MRERSLGCLLLAIAAFVLPWQRCASDCHDRLLPAVAQHDCHQDPCQQHDDEAEHERVEFLSVPVGVPPALVAVPAAQSAAHLATLPTPPVSVTTAPPPLPPDGEPPTETTVLLI